MKQYIEQIQPKFNKAIEYLKTQLATIRSGRATAALVENIKVEAYGTMTPLIELSGITSPEPRLLLISPWDKTIIKDIEKAFQAANLGAQPVVDGAIIRLNFPTLTEERRRELTKVMNTKLEETKVAIRNIREESLNHLKEQKNNGDISEDDFFAIQKELQKVVDENSETIKKLGEDKEKEIMTI